MGGAGDTQSPPPMKPHTGLPGALGPVCPRRQASQPRPPLPSQAKRTMQKPPHARRTAELTPLADTAQPPPLTTRASALPAAGRPGRGNFTQHDRQTPPRPTSAASTLPCSEHLPCSALSKATSTRVWIPLTTYARKFRPLSTYGLDLLTWLRTFTRVPMTQPARLSGQSLSLLPLGGLTIPTDLSGSAHPSCPGGSRCVMAPSLGNTSLLPSLPADLLGAPTPSSPS